MNIRIDNETYTISDSPESCSNGQRALLEILRTLATFSDTPNVRSCVLQELLGLRLREPYEFRLKQLVDRGHLVPRESMTRHLEALLTA
jgi:hypothetical protein